VEASIVWWASSVVTSKELGLALEEGVGGAGVTTVLGVVRL
jgi:hypothetical protein